ncbi:MAG TPA: CDP-alcohol phosphatidyltransferase family protein, partial [Solirubrobacteraceae bacterium]|nr:CDP-alcohol phosphatidyltransferase family protein [Solirubrobacteraceae bacterium]
MPRSDSLTGPLAPVRARRRAPVAAGAAGLVYATAPAADGTAAAALPLDDATILGRLLEQLGTLGLRTAWVVTRPQWRDAVEAVARSAGLDVRLTESADLVEDLRIAAEVAHEAPGTLLVARGDVLTHREALAGLLADPRIVSGVLSGPLHGSGWSFRARLARRRVVSAGSPFHRVRNANMSFLGFLKVDSRDRDALATAARRLAELAADRPEGWAAELERKAGEWRFDRWRAARAGAVAEPPEPEDWPSLPLAAEDEELVALRRRVASEDAVSLLLVGLVRGDVDLAASRLREFYYARPATARDVERALGEMAAIDEDKVALNSAVKGVDGFFTTFFVSPYSKYIARYCARRGWTPNQMTTVSMVIGTVAAAAFALGTRPGMVAGAILLQAAFTIDCVDGQLARYTRTFSKLGAWLDSVFDRGKEYVVFAGLALGATRGFDQDVWLLAAAALALQTARHTLDFSFAVGQRGVVDATPQMPLEHAADVPVAAGVPPDPEDAQAPAPENLVAAPAAAAPLG